MSNYTVYGFDDHFSSIAVPPVQPEEIAAIELNPFLTKISWSLPEDIHTDGIADSFTVSLNFTNGTLAHQLTVEGDVRQVDVNVVPGMEYVVIVTAHNQDGSTPSDQYRFTTQPGGMKIQ